jgi:hypothetical protein
MKFYFIITVLMSILFFSCGKKQKDPCEAVVCDFVNKGQVCNEGDCKCADDTYNLGTWCLSKGGRFVQFDKFYSTAPWGCMDTVVIGISKVGGVIGIGTPNVWGKFERQIAVDNYVSESSGDSFYLLGLGFFSCPLFNNDVNRRVFPIIYGKMNPAKDTLRLKVLWSTDTAKPPLDSNTVVLVR